MNIMEVMDKVVIASKHDVAATQTQWKEGTSRINNTYKALMEQVQLGNLVKGNGYFKKPESQSEFKEHARLVTSAIIEILKINPEAEVRREKVISEIALRPDVLVLCRKGNLAKLCVVEACITETDPYLGSKINLLTTHPDILRIFSSIFKIQIKEFSIVVTGKEAPAKTISLTQLLEALRHEIH